MCLIYLNRHYRLIVTALISMILRQVGKAIRYRVILFSLVENFSEKSSGFSPRLVLYLRKNLRHLVYRTCIGARVADAKVIVT